jgi:UDP-N-acetylglucosamine--N-acetylmuramyl-(pentapeptide) pyrophosphoryl-undecaprenol N-acetylglucosamine transferase
MTVKSKGINPLVAGPANDGCDFPDLPDFPDFPCSPANTGCLMQSLPSKGLWVGDFISRMDYAYAVADLVVSRAGAGTLSELCILKKAAILVPSPNVAEDHQTKNARTLSESNAAVLIRDSAAEADLVPAIIKLLNNKERLCELSENIANFALHNSARRIVDEAVKLIVNTREDEHK